VLRVVTHRRCSPLLTPLRAPPLHSTQLLPPSPRVARTRRTSQTSSSLAHPHRRGTSSAAGHACSTSSVGSYVEVVHRKGKAPMVASSSGSGHRSLSPARGASHPLPRPGHNPFQVHGGCSPRPPQTSSSTPHPRLREVGMGRDGRWSTGVVVGGGPATTPHRWLPTDPF
jgi:hypothetical protein